MVGVVAVVGISVIEVELDELFVFVDVVELLSSLSLRQLKCCRC